MQSDKGKSFSNITTRSEPDSSSEGKGSGTTRSEPEANDRDGAAAGSEPESSDADERSQPKSVYSIL